MNEERGTMTFGRAPVRSAALMLSFLFAVQGTGCADERSSDEVPADEATVATVDPSQDTEQEIESVKRVLGSYTTPRGFHRVYVLIEPNLGDAEVLDIAKRLHAREPETWYYLMDSDSEFDAMLVALPKTAEGDYEGWPADYVEKHFVARLALEVGGTGASSRRWIVEGGPTRAPLLGELS